jgi:class 3 adenylate cyclase
VKTYRLKTILLLAICLFAQILVAQNQQIESLTESLRGASGASRIDILLQLSKAYQVANMSDKAETMAEEASDMARRIKMPELRAKALHQEGVVMMSRGKKKAAARFEQSLDILKEIKSTNTALALENLIQLRQVAAQAGRDKDLMAIDNRIAFLRSGGSIADKIPDSKVALQQELTAAQQKLAENQSVFQENQNKLLQQSQSLQAELAAREAVINQMTEAQMKTAMLMMQQKSLLDSVFYRAGIDSLSVANANLALREAESNRKFNYAIMGVLLLIAGGATFSYFRARQNEKILEVKNKIIREEQTRSDNLLLNILPTLVAQELKEKGKTKAQFHEDVSVLFADFVGFSKIAENLSPQQLVNELDTCFQQFDSIIAQYGLEKIKTIGDAYMCAGGLPDGGGAQMRNIVAAALDMQRWLNTWNAARDVAGQPRFDARIGIHRGPVVAGVVGSKKFAFDIWGDTVNVAARIEQAGEGGRINISGEAYALIKNDFKCQYRGKIAAKNKGEIDMYFVEN